MLMNTDYHSGATAAIIRPYHGNRRDTLSIEYFYQALWSENLNSFHALEIYSDGNEIFFLVRADNPFDLRAVLSAAKSTWPLADITLLGPEEDPSRAFSPENSIMYEARLSEMPILPIRTHTTREGRSSYDDFSRAADPMGGVLSALSTIGPGNRCLVQFALSPMPVRWAAFFRGNLNDIHERAKFSPNYLLGSFFTIISAAALFISLVFAVMFFAVSQKPNYFAFVVGGLIASVISFFIRSNIPMPPDPLIIQQKIVGNAFRAKVRVYISADSPNDAQIIARSLFTAFSGYSHGGANRFVFQKSSWSAPTNMRFSRSWLENALPGVYALLPGKWQRPILSSAELTVLWHIPHESMIMPAVRRATARNISPMPSEFIVRKPEPSDRHLAQTNGASAPPSDGFLCGDTRIMGRDVPVYLPNAKFLNGNIGLVARTQMGKSTMMANIVSHIMRTEPDASIILIDPHRTLAETVLGLVPPSRVDNTIYWDLSNKDYVVGFNMIAYEKENRRNMDKRIQDTVACLRVIWEENWGPRTEDYTREALMSLYAANGVLTREWTWRDFCRRCHEAFIPYVNVIQNQPTEIPLSLVRTVTKLAEELRSLEQPDSLRSAQRYQDALDSAEMLVEVGRYIERGLPLTGDSTLQWQRKVNDFYAATAGYHIEIENSAITDAFEAAYRSRLHRPDPDMPPQVLTFTLLDIPVVLRSTRMTEVVVSLLSNPKYSHLTHWWERNYFDLIRESNVRTLIEYVMPIITKINSFAALEDAKRIVGQMHSTIKIEEIIANGGILLTNLAAGIVGKDTAALIGATIINWCASTIYARQSGVSKIGEKQPKIYIVVDEFQSIPGADFSLLLSELGKFGVRLIMGTQSLSNLTIQRKDANKKMPWLENVHSLFVFACGHEDARTLSGEINVYSSSNEDIQQVTPNDIVGLPQYHCYLRTSDSSGAMRTFMIKTRPCPNPDKAIMQRIRERSNRLFAVPAAVADEIVKATHQRHSLYLGRPADETADFSVGRGAQGQARRSETDAVPSPFLRLRKSTD